MTVFKALIAVACVSACRTSPPPERFQPARDPSGVVGDISLLDGRKITGELLTVGDTAYVMTVEARVTVAPYSILASSRFARVGQVTVRPGEVPSGRFREQAALYSRFPFGIPEPAMAALLGKSGQQVPDTVKVGR